MWIFGAGAVGFLHKDVDTTGLRAAVATLLAFVTGYASIAWLLRFVAGHSIAWFVPYRVALGVLLLALLSTGAITAT